MNTANIDTGPACGIRSLPTRLLVSVRSAEESSVVLANREVSVIDLKEPKFGSLGPPQFDVATEFSQRLDASHGRELLYGTSIALGEAVDGAPWPQESAADAKSLLSRFDFAKFGLSGLAGDDDWVRSWRQAFSVVPESVTRVAVAYADWIIAGSPAPEEVLRAAPNVGAKILLIDTFDKTAGSLLDHLSRQQIESLTAKARESDLKIALAGSLSIRQADELFGMAHFLAVRGAVCGQGRDSQIDPSRLRQLTDAMARSCQR